eukprot:374208-Pleurochrysis_carterae.AAC.1
MSMRAAGAWTFPVSAGSVVSARECEPLCRKARPVSSFHRQRPDRTGVAGPTPRVADMHTARRATVSRPRPLQKRAGASPRGPVRNARQARFERALYAGTDSRAPPPTPPQAPFPALTPSLLCQAPP